MSGGGVRGSWKHAGVSRRERGQLAAARASAAAGAGARAAARRGAHSTRSHAVHASCSRALHHHPLRAVFFTRARRSQVTTVATTPMCPRALAWPRPPAAPPSCQRLCVTTSSSAPGRRAAQQTTRGGRQRTTLPASASNVCEAADNEILVQSLIRRSYDISGAKDAIMRAVVRARTSCDADARRTPVGAAPREHSYLVTAAAAARRAAAAATPLARHRPSPHWASSRRRPASCRRPCRRRPTPAARRLMSSRWRAAAAAARATSSCRPTPQALCPRSYMELYGTPLPTRRTRRGCSSARRARARGRWLAAWSTVAAHATRLTCTRHDLPARHEQASS